MTLRPEKLFQLFGEITKLSGIGPKIAQNMVKMGIETPRDLLFTLPQSVVVRKLIKTATGVVPPSIVTLRVRVSEHIANNRKDRPYRILVSDGSSDLQLVFFHPRKDWLRENYPIGEERIISGKIEMFDHMLQMTHPDYVCTPENIAQIPTSEPIYPLTAGVTQKNMTKAGQQVLENAPDLDEWIDPALVEKYGWPTWKQALETAHHPQTPQDISPHTTSRQRLAYDELLSHQLTLAIARSGMRKAKGIETIATGKMGDKIIQNLPFTPTNAQHRVIQEIHADMATGFRMNRLLQGDVGSGKTLVAMMAMTAAVEAGGQAVMMAPTEILAQQHLAGLRPLAEQAGIVLEALTGRDKGSERAAKLAALEDGKIHILVGTHAVFQKSVIFSDLRLAVIDEQHRFGVRERMGLGAKGSAVDILVMTATPIPRSLALANYGDMDISVLDEKPAGRKPIDTVLVSNARMAQVVERLKSAIGQGRQAYWVCPLVEDSEVLNLVSAEDRAATLKLALGDDNVGLVHGRMSGVEKDAVMGRFQSGEIKVLVATTVIEVGVDVPNASIIVIEHAERFGLSQLHQLRGRVGRGSDASTCLLMYVAPLGTTAQKRLEAIRETNDGFKISEVDLKLRGAGDVLGVAQSGLPRFRIADLETQGDLLKIAHKDARMVLMKDPKLEGERGQAVRTLLHLMEADKYIQLLSVG